MDGLLRGQEKPELIEALFSQCFDYDSRLILFPVRHHSPACSFHLKKVIEEYRPDAVLIEGPENASGLIEYMTASKTKAPFCIYLSFDDKEGKVNKEPDKYRAYYPFLDYSPEYTAIREAKERNLPVRFIDLSYGEKLLNSSIGTETPDGEGRKNTEYDNDKAFGLGQFYEQMVEKTGCRSFNELWEMLFEIDGCHIETRQFVRNLFHYCYYTRLYSSEEERTADGDTAREQVMFENIRKAEKEYHRILVVTGGMHTVALSAMLFDQGLINGVSESTNQGKADPAPIQHPHEVKRITKGDSPAYLMPYTYEASDQASGYQSGMAFPYYYQLVWENMEKQKKLPHEETVLRFIINTASTLRKKQALSIADEMQSYYMAKGLARLRGKRECGVFELLDAVQSSFVKGEINAYYQPALKQLYRLLTGMEVGQVDGGAGVPPLVQDFMAQCKRFRIPTNSTLKKEVRLDVYNKADHREKSQFFFQMQFLDTGFCTCQGSQEDNGSTGRILLRETWEYRFMPQVQSALINASVYGATLKEASLSVVAQKLRNEHHTAASLAELLKQAWRMGLTSCFGSLFAQLTRVVGDDMDFISVMTCFECLCSIENRAEIEMQVSGISLPEDFEQLKKLCLNRGFTLLYTVINATKAEEDEICRKIQYLHQYFLEDRGEEEQQFLEDMQAVIRDPQANKAVLGVCFGTLLKKEQLGLDQVFDRFSSYVDGSDDTKWQAVSFLKGFFMTAKDIVFVDDRLLILLDEIIRSTDGEQFVALLPDLRLAFTSFLPFETDRIAERVASLYGASLSSILYEAVLNQEELEDAIAADAYCAQAMNQWFGGYDGTD